MARKPELVVIAGPNGSGKTTITRRLIQHAWGKDCLYLNPDEMAQSEFGDWNSPESSLQAARKVSFIREECLVSQTNLMFETVFSAPDKLDYIRRAKVAGFWIRLFFICTDDPKINLGRIARRFAEGGHDVPQSKVISRYTKSIANCAVAVGIADRAYLYDNSVENENPILLFRTANGTLQKLYRDPVNAWASEILAQVRK